MGRGSIIARQGGIRHRTCSYADGLTRLSAQVDSASGYSERYKTQVELDEDSDELVSYDCTCPAAYNYAGPCKHSIAVALDFVADPTRYRGYSRTQHARTSAALRVYLDQSAAAPTLPAGAPTAETQGDVRLVPTLTWANDLALRLQVRGAAGTYVVKSLSDLLHDVDARAFHQYGKKLAFTHDPQMFDDRSRDLLAFLRRAALNRASFSVSRYAPYGYAAGSSTSSMGRELRLSLPEVDELMGVLVGSEVTLETVSPQGRAVRPLARTLPVRDGDPDLGLDLLATNGAYALVPRTRAGFFQGAAGLYAVAQDAIWRCTPRLVAVSDFLTKVYDGAYASHPVLAGDDAGRFAATALPALEGALPMDVPEELEALRPKPCRIEFYLDYGSGGVTCDVQAVYGDKRHHLMGRLVGERVEAGRDVTREVEARQLALRYLVGGTGSRATISSRDSAAIAALLFDGVTAFRKLGDVYATPAFERLVSRGRPRVQLRVSTHSNLIDLEVSTTDLPLDELHALLASYRRKRRFHRLRDGSFVDLEGLDLAEADRMAEELGLSARDLARGRAEIPAYKAFLLDSMLSDDEKDESFSRYVDGFRALDPSTYEVPESLGGRLRPYQVAGFQWMSALMDMSFGGILADEMGLGKTAQVIAVLLARRGSGPALVVCPASLVYNWQAEFQKFAPGIDVAVVAGTASERAQLRGEDHEVYVTSYDLLRRDVADWAAMPLWMEVLDEAQYIKNHETLVARAVKALQTQHRMALTGTPVENRLSELWSIFDFLMPGLLGSYESFRDRYEQPIADGDEEAAARLSAAVGPFILRRLKADVLKDLPDKLEQVVYAHMEGEQRRLYLAHEQALRMSLAKQDDGDFGRGKLQVLAELTRLRQVCCDPRLAFEDYDGPSCKLDAIVELVEACVDADRKMLVFSQFTTYLGLIADELDERGIAYYTITGSTPKRRRLELVDAFNADATPVFLISLKAGGTGLNLVGASVVVHADPWWNAAAQDQATDRAHRIGQTRDVTVYKVIVRDTIEDRILALQEEKSELARQVVGEGGGMGLASLRREDLIELLG